MYAKSANSRRTGQVSEIRDKPSRQGSCSFQFLPHDNVMCLNHDSPSLVQTKIMHETEGQVIWVCVSW